MPPPTLDHLKTNITYDMRQLVSEHNAHVARLWILHRDHAMQKSQKKFNVQQAAAPDSH